MRLVYKRFSVIGGFAVLLVILVINAAVTRRQLDVQDSNQGWVEHTQRVQLELTTVESLLKDAETAPISLSRSLRPRKTLAPGWACGCAKRLPSATGAKCS